VTVEHYFHLAEIVKYFRRKRNKDDKLSAQDFEKRREVKKFKEEETREQKQREKEAARAYERWLYRKVFMFVHH